MFKIAPIISIFLCTLFLFGCSSSNQNKENAQMTQSPSLQQNSSQMGTSNMEGKGSNSLDFAGENLNTNPGLEDSNSLNSGSPNLNGANNGNSANAGVLNITVNGSPVEYRAFKAIDKNATTERWEIYLGRTPNIGRDSMWINLPLDVRAGDEFFAGDAALGSNLSEPLFDFAYNDRQGTYHALELFGDSQFENFKLKITKWPGRGGYAEGTLSYTLRPWGSDETYVFKNGSFRIKIRD